MCAMPATILRKIHTLPVLIAVLTLPSTVVSQSTWSSEAPRPLLIRIGDVTLTNSNIEAWSRSVDRHTTARFHIRSVRVHWHEYWRPRLREDEALLSFLKVNSETAILTTIHPVHWLNWSLLADKALILHLQLQKRTVCSVSVCRVYSSIVICV